MTGTRKGRHTGTDSDTAGMADTVGSHIVVDLKLLRQVVVSADTVML